jgi:hypothetical protein
MKSFRFKKIDYIDPAPWIEKIGKLSEDAWFEWTEKQEVSSVHSDTTNIGLMYDINYGVEDIVEGAKSRFYEYFFDELKYVEEVIKKHYGAGKILRAELARLHKGCSVPNHIDQGVSLVNNERIHLPIITDEKVKFWVDGETIFMSPGELTEINNIGEHGVQNNSNIDRIHLIIDYYKYPTVAI